MDYLSWLRDNPEAKDSVIVLNSVNLIDNAIDKATTYAKINVYFDRDKAGETAFHTLQQALPHAQDQSFIYAGHNDYNEMLMARPPDRLPWEETNIFDKVLATYRR